MQRSRRALGPDHPTTLRAAAGLTLALLLRSEVEAARALGADILRHGRRVLGPDHLIKRYLSQVAAIGHLVLGDDDVSLGPRREV